MGERKSRSKSAASLPSVPTQGVAPDAQPELPETVSAELQAAFGNPLAESETRSLFMARISSSPWPSAQTLADMNALEPGLHRELIDEFKMQAEHRRALERATVEHSLNVQDRSQRNAFIVALGGMAVAGLLAYFKLSDVVAAIIVIAAIGGPSAATVLARLIDKWR